MSTHDKGRPKRSKCKLYMKNSYTLIKELESSLIKSEQIDRQVLLAVGLDHLKNQSLTQSVKEVRTENKYLLNMLQLGDSGDMSRSNSASSCSTMSLVHLQYKYEELINKYNGLLKVLDMRLSESRKSQEENNKMREEIEILKVKLQNCEEFISALKKAIKDTKSRKNLKILKLRAERNTLRIVHNRLVSLLNEQWSEHDKCLCEQIKYTTVPDEALLIKEIRKNNLLSYENFHLQQEIEYLQSVLNVKPVKSHGSISIKSKK